MSKYFNEQLWSEQLTHPDWYLRIQDEYKRLLKLIDEKPTESAAVKKEIRDFFEHKLAADEVFIAKTGPNFDEERKAIDTVVIHHTSAEPGYTLARMNVVQLLNVYVPYFASEEYHIKGQPIWSNHFDGDGKQVFYAYHWLVRMDGSTERLLRDDQIGWHAGNWDINRRSVAICLDNDYSQSEPAKEVLETVAKLIKQHYPSIKPDEVLGHREINPKTICPGEQFSGAWKKSLVGML